MFQKWRENGKCRFSFYAGQISVRTKLGFSLGNKKRMYFGKEQTVSATSTTTWTEQEISVCTEKLNLSCTPVR